LEACSILKTKGTKNFHCTIIGDGPQSQEILQSIEKHDIQDFVSLTGAVPYERVIEYYEKASIAVLAAVSEFHRGIPNVVAEAMAMEVPVITTPLPAISELIENGKNGVIVPEKDSDSLSEAIKNLIESNDLRTDFAREGRLTVERLFDMKKTYAELNDIFEQHI
jgi:glycosyltransferase involved in cell wall biosynthesis